MAVSNFPRNVSVQTCHSGCHTGCHRGYKVLATWCSRTTYVLHHWDTWASTGWQVDNFNCFASCFWWGSSKIDKTSKKAAFICLGVSVCTTKYSFRNSNVPFHLLFISLLLLVLLCQSVGFWKAINSFDDKAASLHLGKGGVMKISYFTAHHVGHQQQNQQLFTADQNTFCMLQVLHSWCRDAGLGKHGILELLTQCVSPYICYLGLITGLVSCLANPFML